MGSYLQLQTKLEALTGTRNVHFQPPESMKISYPAVIFSFANVLTRKADDITYNSRDRYSIKYISQNPDNSFRHDILKWPYCTFDRRYISDNLYHDCFDLYF